jgi:hypothetical protein
MQLLSKSLSALYDGINLEEVLVALKQQGVTQLECTKLLYQELSLSLAQADALVLQARAWEQERALNLTLRDRG